METLFFRDLIHILNWIKSNRPIKIALAGSSGVGKSALGGKINESYQEIHHIEWDLYKHLKPCMVSSLNIEICLSTLLNDHRIEFILDIPGDTIFKQNKFNQDRLKIFLNEKQKYGFSVLLLHADKNTVRRRYLSSIKGGTPVCFEIDWNNWENFEKPFWEKCADYLIDTTYIDLCEVNS